MPRRHKVLVTVLLLVGVLVIATVAALVAGDGGGSTNYLDDIQRSVDDALLGERYHADLTKGKGDFTVVDDGGSASSYASDGYHLFAQGGAPAMRGVQINGTHSSLGVRIEVRTASGTAPFAFGPFCWHTPTEGYGLLVSTSGEAFLAESRADAADGFRMVRSSKVFPLDWSRWHTLRIDCSVTGAPGSHGTLHLRGSIDGQVVVRGTTKGRADVIAYAGFAGANAGTAPVDWVVRTYDRLGADDVGRN
ncbi:MAG: hypothetical protein ACKO2C_05870 [Actinomycetes bacterium]